MASGFQVLDPVSGKVVIDSEYIRFGLLQSGIATTLSSTTEAGAGYRIIVNDAICPVVFIEGAGVIVSSTRSGNNWTVDIAGWPNIAQTGSEYLDEPGLGFAATLNHSPRYYVFDFMRPNKERYGIEILKPTTGETIFNSNQWPMNIVASVEATSVVDTYRAYTGGGNFYVKRGGWQNTGGGNDLAVSFNALGLNNSRRYAAYYPWTRGAQYGGYYDDFTLLEAIGCYGGALSWGWVPDPLTTFGMTDGGFGVHNAQPNRPRVSLVDVTDIPFPFRY